ncbi:MAG: protein kinase [Phycisphaerales bacterium]|nr:protein kinase [Phycisphaerales bacterium]
MTHPNHRRAADLFKAALDLDAGARSAFLDAQCADEPDLRSEVDSLLEADVCADQFLSAPPERVRALAAQSDAMVGQRLGGYRIVRRIAVGGMGAVYEAVQEQLGRTVALKVVRSGSTTDSALRRFEYEAKFLARLRHVAIAQIYEAGTHTTGGANLPYFAMEYVPNAQTLVQYSDEHGLSKRQRLELFVQACDAVQYAHQLGVIHRDLKPSNILVGHDSTTASDEPEYRATLKVIDFGVARLVQSDFAVTSMHTAYGQLLGTLQYMSPEQCGADPEAIDIRSDVYSLGVVLYELLAGQLPYDVQRLSLVDAARVIAQAPLPRIGALTQTSHGDLDTIVRKAMEKDRERRYRTAAELSDDIRHYLRNEPIAARPPSMTYLLGAFARRNKAMVTGLVAVLLVLVGGIVTTSWQASRARASERIARESLRDLYVARARSLRYTQLAGQRTAAMDALSKAAAIRPDPDLRDEVMTTLSVPDVRETTFPLPDGSISAVLSPDLLQYAATLADGSIQIGGVKDGRQRARIPPPVDPVLNPIKLWCNQQFVIRLFDRDQKPRRLELWRVDNPAMILEVSDIPDRASFDVSADETTLAIGRSDHAIHFYDLLTGQETRRIELDRDPSYLQFDPTGRRIARFHARDSQASILDLETQESARIFEGSNIAFAVAWSPDGKFIAGSEDYLIRIWDVDKHREIAVLPGHESGVVHLRFSHDGRLLVSYGWDGKSIIWELATLRPLLRLDVQTPAFSSDDQTLAGLVSREGKFTVNILDMLNGDYFDFVSTELGIEAAVGSGSAVHPNGRIAVCGVHRRADESSGLQCFDVAQRTCIGSVRCGKVETMRFNSIGTSLYTAGRDGLIKWPVRIDQNAVRFGPPQILLADENAEQFDVSADGAIIASVSWVNQTITFLDAQSAKFNTHNALTNARSVALSPNGRWAAVTTWQGAGCEIWDVNSQTVVARLDVSGSAMPAFSPDGKWLAIRDWSGISILRAPSWDKAHRIDVAGFTRVGFSRDSRLLIASDEQSKIHLIDLSTGKTLTSFYGPGQLAATDPMITSDGLLVAFAQRGALVQIWDLHAMRKTLASLRLDWDHPMYLTSEGFEHRKPKNLTHASFLQN